MINANQNKPSWFDLRRGPVMGRTTGSQNIVWRGDAWLHYAMSSGMGSILMPEKIVLKFASFLRQAAEHPKGVNLNTGNLMFGSENHEGVGFEKNVNIVIGGTHFVVIFNMPVNNLIGFAKFLEDNSKE